MRLLLALHAGVESFLHQAELFGRRIPFGLFIPAAEVNPAQASVNLKVGRPVIPEPMLEVQFALGMPLTGKIRTYTEFQRRLTRVFLPDGMNAVAHFFAVHQVIELVGIPRVLEPFADAEFKQGFPLLII